MKTIIMILLLQLVAGSGMAAEKKSAKDSAEAPVATGDRQGAAQKTAEKKTTVQWPRPYKSTEEVSADSMVPFPTDI